MLAMFDYSDRDSIRPYNQMLGNFEQLFTAIFIIECVIKIIAFGFIKHKKAYLKDSWNWLDFFVVLVSLSDYLPNSGDSASALKGLRTFRILRPLRSINSMPSMKRLIGSMLASIPGLLNVVLFLFFIFVLFGIFGTQQF
jgi:voltage-dependent calcium channel L type alpha-1D